MQVHNLKINCNDGVQLAASLFKAKTAKGAVLIAPATGIKRGFYKSFASHLAGSGYSVLSFDNRGIGDSVNGKINAVDASLINWGKLDMVSSLNKLQDLEPGVPYHLIGHSAGGQLMGLMDNCFHLSSMFNVASSSGNLSNMTYPFKLSAIFYMNIFIPFSNALFGKTNSQWVGMGEPLPRKVAAQWREWCNGSGYVKVELDKGKTVHYYNEVQVPSKWVYATDDAIACEENVREMIAVYSKIKPEITPLTPEALGYSEIGHMKFFSSKKKELWTLATDWLDMHNSN